MGIFLDPRRTAAPHRADTSRRRRRAIRAALALAVGAALPAQAAPLAGVGAPPHVAAVRLAEAPVPTAKPGAAPRRHPRAANAAGKAIFHVPRTISTLGK